MNWERFNDQFRETFDETQDRWRAIKTKRKAEGKCWQVLAMRQADPLLRLPERQPRCCGITKMTDEKKQTPCEIIAKLAAMSPQEFNQFMHEHFQKLCSQPISTADQGGPSNG